MKIKQLDIYEDKGIMYLSFDCVNDARKYIQKTVFEELARLNINKETNGWYDIDHNFDMRWDERNNKIVIREKNNPPGPYGKTSVLVIVPSFLMDQGLMTREDVVDLEKRIKDSDPVKKRDSSTIIPGYALKR